MAAILQRQPGMMSCSVSGDLHFATESLHFVNESLHFVNESLHFVNESLHSAQQCYCAAVIRA